MRVTAKKAPGSNPEGEVLIELRVSRARAETLGIDLAMPLSGLIGFAERDALREALGEHLRTGFRCSRVVRS